MNKNSCFTVIMAARNDRAGMIALSGHLVCATGDEATIVALALPEHVRLTRNEPGVLRFSVTPTDDPLRWAVDEAFLDQAAFDAHRARSAASDWGRLTAGISRDYVVLEH